MEVRELMEFENGSVLIEINATNAEKELLIQEGLKALLMRFVEEEEKLRGLPALERKDVCMKEIIK